MKNFSISVLIVSIISLATLHLLKTSEVILGIPDEVVLFVVLLATMLFAAKYCSNYSAMKVLSSVTMFAAAFSFSLSILHQNNIYLSPIYLVLAAVCVAIDWQLLVDIESEVVKEEKRKYFSKMLALMFIEFVALTYFILQIAIS